MTEKNQKSAFKTTKNKKKRRKCRSRSKDENFEEESHKKRLNCNERVKGEENNVVSRQPAI